MGRLTMMALTAWFLYKIGMTVSGIFTTYAALLAH